MKTYPDTRDGAEQCLADNASTSVVVCALKLVRNGTCEWRPDPEVTGVWGLVPTGTEPDLLVESALIIVHCTTGNCDVSDAFWGQAEEVDS